MIIETILKLFNFVFQIIGVALPTVTAFSIETVQSLISIGNYFYMLNQIIDIPTLFLALTTIVAFEITMVGIQLARWTIRAIPFLNSRV